MANVHYRLRGTSDNESIYLQLSIDSKRRFEKRTGLAIPASSWSKATKHPKQNSAASKQLTSKLRGLRTFLLDQVNTALAEGAIINSGWLKNNIDIHFNRVSPTGDSELVIDAISHVIDGASNRRGHNGVKGISKSRIQAYHSLLRLFIDFQGTRSIKVKEVDISLGNEFVDHLIEKRDYSEGYALKMLSNLKTVCSDAEVRGIPVSHQLRHIRVGKPKPKDIVYLNKDELEKVKAAKLTQPYLENARRWLLIGCNIGQRVSDLLVLSDKNIVERYGHEMIELRQKKTGKDVTIPIFDEVKELIKDGFPKAISSQNFNKYIKEVCAIAGINEQVNGSLMDPTTGRKKRGVYPKYELITSHVCRRSFATNNYGIWPTPLITQITGHSSEKTLLTYIGKSSVDFARMIIEFLQMEEVNKK